MINLRRLLPLIVVWAGLLLLFQAWVWRANQPASVSFIRFTNMVDLSQQVSVNAILAFGMTLVILTGGIDLSVGAVMAFAGVAAVSAIPHFGSVGGIVVGLGVGAGVGMINGLFVSRTRMPPFIITLATMMMAKGAALRFNQNQPLPVPRDADAFNALGNLRLFDSLPLSVAIMLAVFLGMAILLHRTRFGQHLFAIGGNREAARFTGIRVARHEFAVYVLSGTLAGLAGIIQASQLYSAIPSSGIGAELGAIAAVVVGGTSFTGGIGSIPGTLLGAVIIGTLDKGLNQARVHFSWQDVIKGAVILAAVWFDVRRRARRE